MIDGLVATGFGSMRRTWTISSLGCLEEVLAGVGELERGPLNPDNLASNATVDMKAISTYVFLRPA